MRHGMAYFTGVYKYCGQPWKTPVYNVCRTHPFVHWSEAFVMSNSTTSIHVERAAHKCRCLSQFKLAQGVL